MENALITNTPQEVILEKVSKIEKLRQEQGVARHIKEAKRGLFVYFLLLVEQYYSFQTKDVLELNKEEFFALYNMIFKKARMYRWKWLSISFLWLPFLILKGTNQYKLYIDHKYLLKNCGPDFLSVVYERIHQEGGLE